MDYDCYCNMNEDNTNEVDLGHVEINYDSDSNQETHDALTGNTSAINAMRGRIILDLGCMRGCVGVPWALQRVKHLQSVQRICITKPCHEVFRFGDGDRRVARLAMSFESALVGNLALVRLDVLDGPGPPLCSRSAMSSLGISVHCADHTIDVKTVGVRGFDVRPIGKRGHYTVSVDEFDNLPKLQDSIKVVF